MLFRSPFNTSVQNLYNRYGELLRRFERDQDSTLQGKAVSDSDLVILGMGRVGQGAYNYLKQNYDGSIIGVEDNLEKATELQELGYNCIQGDANDQNFWTTANLDECQLVLVSLTNHSENLSVVKTLRQFGYNNRLAVIARYPDEREELLSMGCISFNLYGEAGHGFAEHVMTEIGAGPSAGL